MVIDIKNCDDKYYYGVYNLFKNIYPYANVVRDNNGGGITAFSYIINNEYVTVNFEGKEISEKIIYGNILLAIERGIYKLTDANLDFGVLTGIRPTKIALKFPENEALKRLRNDYFISEKKAEIIAKCAEYEKKLDAELTDRDAALYINIPFCKTRCAYCSFTVSGLKDYRDVLNDYWSALTLDLTETINFIKQKNLSLHTVYIGGGTPTVLTNNMLDYLTGEIAKNFPDLNEFTVEAGRSDTITSENLKILKDNGVTRISVNPQSLNQKTLDEIGRKTTVAGFYNAYNTARSLGFHTINTDLIAGFSNEKFSDFKYSFDEIVKLAPENITVHTLAKKRASNAGYMNTLEFFHEEIKEMLNYSYDALKNNYEPYYIYRNKNAEGENIGFSVKGKLCAYNIIMMEEIGNVIAVGAGGVSKTPGGGKLRIDKQPQTYIKDIKNIINRKREFFKATSENLYI